MIYNAAEIIVTFFDCIILFAFLINVLTFRSLNKFSKNAITFCFVSLMSLNIMILNYHFVLEGAFIALYFVVLFIYCRLALKGKWWYQFVLILIEFGCLFVTNSAILVVTSIILNDGYSEIIMMRNPARLFLLFLSKIILSSFLLLISHLIKRKSPPQLSQSLSLITCYLVSIVVGTIIEKLILEQIIPVIYANIVMISISAIDILLFYLMIQFSTYNQTMMEKIALQTRLSDEEKILHETLRWSKSIRSLKHDLNNHLLAVREYISTGSEDKALQYIDKIAGKLPDIPVVTETNNQTLNAILDFKRMVCIQENIAVKCYLPDDMPEYDDVALNTILSNLIDNAIEAERFEIEKEIRLSLEMEGDYLHIIVQNRISKPVLIDGNLPESSKFDKRNHGLGMYSINETVSKKEGAISIYEEDGWFIADILLLANSQ